MQRKPSQQVFGDFNAAHLARRQCVAELPDALLMQGFHSITFGTR
jgi:hypothetical protein